MVRIMDGQPLMPGTHRFPMNPAAPPTSDEPPSVSRPFILRGVRPRPVHATGQVVGAKHRTSPGQTLIPRKCNEDGKLVDDSYTVPDN